MYVALPVVGHVVGHDFALYGARFRRLIRASAAWLAWICVLMTSSGLVTTAATLAAQALATTRVRSVTSSRIGSRAPTEASTPPSVRMASDSL
jgi:hypothetical protein